MEITIESTTPRPLLKRSEITARVFFDGATPSRTQIADAIANKANVKRDLLIVDTIDTKFGETAAMITARSYSDADTMKKLERANLIEKNVKPAPAPEPTPEPVAEESVEEAEAATEDEPEKEE